jgi:hypothetical protein
LRFKTNHGGTVYRGDVHLRDIEFQPTAQLAGGVISRTICLGDRRFLPIVEHRGVILSAIFIAAALEEEDATRMSLSAPEAPLFSSTMSSPKTLNVWSASDSRMSPDLLRGMGKSIGGDLDVHDEGFEQCRFEPVQSLHHGSVGYQYIHT